MSALAQTQLPAVVDDRNGPTHKPIHKPSSWQETQGPGRNRGLHPATEAPGGMHRTVATPSDKSKNSVLASA